MRPTLAGACSRFSPVRRANILTEPDNAGGGAPFEYRVRRSEAKTGPALHSVRSITVAQPPFYTNGLISQDYINYRERLLKAGYMVVGKRLVVRCKCQYKQ